MAESTRNWLIGIGFVVLVLVAVFVWPGWWYGHPVRVRQASPDSVPAPTSAAGAVESPLATPTLATSPLVAPTLAPTATLTPTVAFTPTATMTPTVAFTPTVPSTPTLSPSPTPTPEPASPPITGTAPVTGTAVSAGSAAFEITGVPEEAENVLVASGDFSNTIGLGSEMVLAEPGVLLVDPDFPQDVINASGGAIARFNPITQFTLNNPGETRANAEEGAFLWFTGATAKVSIPSQGVEIFLEGEPANNWFFLVRGLFADGKQDVDRNSTVIFEGYVAGHAQIMRHPAGAFISEDQFVQVAETSHTGGSNCGKEGCSGLSVLMLDLNTGAYVVLHQTQLNEPWQFVDSNW